MLEGLDDTLSLPWDLLFWPRLFPTSLDSCIMSLHMNSAHENNPEIRIKDLSPERRRVIRAWCIYDWANSAFATSGVAAITPIYFVFLFKEALGESATVFGISFTGSSVWSLAVVISTLTVALSSPVLGVISDRVPIKKTLLWVYTVGGALFTALAFFSAYTGHSWAWLIGTFALANIGFSGGLVFYNSFLPHLGPRHLWDDISSRGFAYGYAGGGILLLAHLALILATRNTDFADLSTRIAIVSIGFWWFGWAIWTLRVVPEPAIHRPARGLTAWSAMAMGFSQLAHTFRRISRFKVVLVYLAAYLLFNDGLQTVLAIAGAFAADTLGITLVFNMATIVIIQFVAVPGAMFFAWLAMKISTKSALVISLLVWIFIVLLGVAIVPLSPSTHSDFDFQLQHRTSTNDYMVTGAPESDDAGHTLQWGGETWNLEEGTVLAPRRVRNLPNAVRSSDDFRYSLSIQGGGMDGENAINPTHPSELGSGLVDWWPTTVREILWKPLGLAVGYQWLLLGVLVGMVIGGSQALARSLFAQITPGSRSGEFFSFFGFISRTSSVLGPILYIAATSLFDTRVAVVSILLIIVAGTILLRRVDVNEGIRVAASEEARTQDS